MPKPHADLRADLHLHSTASDGELSPQEVVRVAKARGMDIIALTDHDTVAGVVAAQAEGEKLSITVLSGIELTCGGTEDVHLLGYGLNPEDPRLLSFLSEQMAERRERMEAMLDKLGTLGVKVPKEETSDPSGQFMGRMNLARAMTKRKVTQTIREAFDRFLGPGKPAYVPRKRLEVSRGIALLRSFGALVSLAHPGRLSMDEQALLALLPGWKEAGLNAIEAYYHGHTESLMLHYDRIAKRYGLLVTGGSDCHGHRDEDVMIGDHLRGWRSVTEDIGALTEALASIRRG